MAEIDSLTIKVGVETNNAVNELNAVMTAVTTLQAAAKDKGVKNLERSLKGLSTAGKGLNGLSRAVKAIEKLEISPKLKENLDKIADASTRLSKVGSGLKGAADGLAKITGMASDTDIDAKFSAVAESVGKFATALNDAVSEETLKRIERLAESLDKIAKSSSAAKVTAKIEDSGSGKAAKTSIKWQAVTKALETVRRGISGIGKGLYGVLDASGIISDLNGIAGAVSKNIPVLGELTAAWRTEAEEIKQIMLSEANIVDKAAEMMLVKVKHLVKVLYSFAKIPFNSMKLTGGIVNLIKLPVKGFADKITDLTKRWDRFTASIARIAVYRLIRTALKELTQGIKEGVENLYQWGLAWQSTYASAASFVNSMDRLSTAFLYLKNSVGAAVSPLIDYVAPIIDRLIDRFVALTNAINQALAALTGAGFWRKALRYPKSYAEAASSATGKVKELERTVLAFDELNKLNDTKDPSGGGSADDLDYSKMFEEATVDNLFADLINSTSWRRLGTIIADKFNEALESINWDSVQSKARTWARRFGSLFDGFFIGVDMPLVGESIAEGLNTIAQSINTFFGEIHFRTLGQHLADGFETMIDTMEWDSIGRAIVQKWKALFETFIGFSGVNLTGLGKGIVELFENAINSLPISDFADAIARFIPKLGVELGKAINGIFSKTNETMGLIPFKKLGESFAKGINFAIANIDAAEAGKFFTNGLSAIIDFTTGALNKIDWNKLQTKLGTMVRAMFENIDLTQATQNAVKIAEKLLETLNTIVESIDWEKIGDALASVDTSGLINGFKKLFNNVVDGLKRAGVLDEVAGGIVAYIGLKLGSMFAKLIPSIMPFLAAKAGASAGTAGAGAASTGGIAAIGSTLGTTLLAAFAAAIGGGAIGELIDHHIIAPILEKLGSDSASWYKNFKWFGEGGFFQEMFDFSSLNEAIETYKGAFKLLGEDIKQYFKDAWEVVIPECVRNALSSIATSISNSKIVSAWKGMTDTLKTSTSNALDNIKSWYRGFFDTVSNGINQLTNSFNNLNTVGKASAARPRTSNPHLNFRASGGTVDKGDLFIAGEAGPEIVTSYGGESTVMNMDQIISTIAQSVAGAGGGDITIPISLDGNLLDRVIVTAQQRQSLRSGR